LARNYEDVQDSWASVADIIEYYAQDIGGFSNYAGPGYYNSPDEVGFI
jgi:alpha-N-acetylgalactosaminidase